MSLHAKGIDLDKACVLIALERQFGYVDEFLIDYFLEFGNDGFNSDHFYLIAESMPAIVLQYGSWTVHSKQNEPYTVIYDRNTNMRYRIANDRIITYIYQHKDKSTDGHAVAIYASELNYYIIKEKFTALILPQGMLIDYRSYERDYPS